MDLSNISDYMSTEFAHITPDMQVDEASRKLIKKAVIGAPVVDDEGKLLGWVSEQECLRVTLQVAYMNQSIATVREVMRTDVLTVKQSDDPLELAQQMLKQKPKNYPVVDAQNKVIGVITRRLVLQMLIDKLPKHSTRARAS